MGDEVINERVKQVEADIKEIKDDKEGFRTEE